MNIHDSIKLDASVKLISESVYLIISNKKKCAEILNKPELSDGDIIDVFISLHLILEVSLNALFRQLSMKFINTMSIIKSIDELELIENIDKIDFITKTTLFIYNSKFNFDNKLPDAAKYYSIIGTLKKFSEMRNRLLHGHSISTTIEDGKSPRDSKLKKNLTTKYLEEQIGEFKFIMEGIRFYLDCLESSLSPEGKESYKTEFLSDDFLKNATPLKNTSF